MKKWLCFILAFAVLAGLPCLAYAEDDFKSFDPVIIDPVAEAMTDIDMAPEDTSYSRALFSFMLLYNVSMQDESLKGLFSWSDLAESAFGVKAIDDEGNGNLYAMVTASKAHSKLVLILYCPQKAALYNTADGIMELSDLISGVLAPNVDSFWTFTEEDLKLAHFAEELILDSTNGG